MDWFRPIAMTDSARPAGALPLAGGWCWFDRAERLGRDGRREIVAAADLPADLVERLTSPRTAFAGLLLDRPQVMGIVNVTPDSFSDGGLHATADAALAQGRALLAAGVAILDIGGESTRPGAAEVPVEEEIARVLPVIAGLAAEAPVSVDTRKAAVAAAALESGACVVNDVSALTFDAALAGVVAAVGVPVILMHAQGRPETMQDDPRYDDVLIDVYEALELRVAAALAAGIARDRIVIDPGIGFGKTKDHNLALMRGLSLFHGLGLPVMLGVSRKRFIGTIGGADRAADRAPGTLALTLAGIAQGIQLHRVHDAAEIVQGIRLWRAATGKGEE